MTGDEKKDSNLIGQFGVGFYSVFMVASQVKLVTKRAGSDEEAIEWISSGDTSFEIGTADKKDHCTEITVYLKDDEDEFTNDWQIRSADKKIFRLYCFPHLPSNDKGEEEAVNESKPIWKKTPSEIKDELHNEFFKSCLDKWMILWKHNS